MPVKTIVGLLAVFTLILFLPPVAMADEMPPPGSKPLSAVLKSVEKDKSGLVTEAEFDDQRWEIKICRAGDCQKLYIDPVTGTESRRRKTAPDDDLPPADAVPLSAVVQSIEDRNLGVVTEAEFDDGLWEIKVRKNGRKTKFHIEPTTGNMRKRGGD